jgi:hypothetical protein
MFSSTTYTNILKNSNINNTNNNNQTQNEYQSSKIQQNNYYNDIKQNCLNENLYYCQQPSQFSHRFQQHVPCSNQYLTKYQSINNESTQIQKAVCQQQINKSELKISTSNDQIKVSQDGHISNIPPNMLFDQFGMLGLILMLTRKEDSSEADQNISVILGKGNLVRSLLQRSVSCFSNQYYQSIFIDPPNSNPFDYNDSMHLVGAPLKMPPEYLGIYSRIKEKLINFNELLNNCQEDVLFFLFYVCCQDELQLKASATLNSRSWLFHKSLRSWIKPANQSNSTYLNDNFTQMKKIIDANDEFNAKNIFFVFDVESWEIKKMKLE